MYTYAHTIASYCQWIDPPHLKRTDLIEPARGKSTELDQVLVNSICRVKSFKVGASSLSYKALFSTT